MKALTAPWLAGLLLAVHSLSVHCEPSGDFTATSLSPSLVFLQGKGGNILLSKGDDGLLIIDDDYADMADALKAQLMQHGGVDQLQYVLNTHWHGDHTGTNTVWGESALIVAHDNVRKRLSERQAIPLFNMVSEPYPPQGLPTLTYPDSMRIYFNGDEITLQHFSHGHTDGDSVVFFKEANLVHMGDHLFYPMFPFIDLASGGNAVQYADNVGEILKRIDNNTTVVPGHGPVTDKAGLSRYHQMLVGTIEEVQAMKQAGKTLQQAQAIGLSDRWQEWSNGFIKQPVWISFIYDSL